MKFILSIAAAAFLFAACNQSATVASATDSKINLDSARTQISAINDQFVQANIKGDSATVVGFYHSEAKVFAPNQPAGDAKVMGSLVATVPGMGITKFSLTTTELLGDGEIIFEEGKYEFGSNDQTFDKGNYMVIWKQENGTWKLYRDMWASENPLPKP